MRAIWLIAEFTGFLVKRGTQVTLGEFVFGARRRHLPALTL